jgi:two-component system, response regulator PdtaR
MSHSTFSEPTTTDASGDKRLTNSGRKVVIVEDEGITQLDLRKFITFSGLPVVGVASNGEEAVKVVRKTKPDIILMDINMPKMNGLEAADTILEELEVCIVIMTAYPTELNEKSARAIGVAGFLRKPINYETLVNQIDSFYESFQERLIDRRLASQH